MKAFFHNLKTWFGIRSDECGHPAEYFRFYTCDMCNTLSQPQIHKLCMINKPVLDLGCINNFFPFMEGL